MSDKINNLKKASAVLVRAYYQKHYWYFKWYSSAQKLEKALKKAGIANPPKLYYEYKFPGGLKNFEVDKKTDFIRCFYPWYLRGDQEVVEYKKMAILDDLFDEISRFTAMNLISVFYFFVCFAITDVQELTDCFDQTYQECTKQVEQLADSIWKLNPELQFIKDYKHTWFVNGAIYGFAPKEIDFFIRRIRRYEAKAKKNIRKMTGDELDELNDTDEEYNYMRVRKEQIEKFIGDSVTYILAPETCDELLKVIESQNNLVVNRKTGIFARLRKQRN